MTFQDRRDAGRQLAGRLTAARADAPVVFGLPRGGVPVAAEVAAHLGAPLDVLLVRKLGCPWQPELGVGALGEEGEPLLNHELVAGLGLSQEQLDAVVSRERAELRRRVRAYRGTHPPRSVVGKTAIVVDDGLATGFTARAAIEILRRRGARRVVLAVPVAPSQTITELRGVADKVICLKTPKGFLAIGEWYQDFRQVTDEEVQRLLEEAPSRSAGENPACVDEEAYAGRGHVLLESHRCATARAQAAALQEVGLTVTSCYGPANGAGNGCPLVAGQPCPWVEAADVVVHDLAIDNPEHRAVLRALRHSYPDTPVVLELPASTAREHASLLEGCTIIHPFDMDRLVHAVVDALASSRPLDPAGW